MTMLYALLTQLILVLGSLRERLYQPLMRRQEMVFRWDRLCYLKHKDSKSYGDKEGIGDCV